jgi:hypothetical protein
LTARSPPYASFVLLLERLTASLDTQTTATKPSAAV